MDKNRWRCYKLGLLLGVESWVILFSMSGSVSAYQCLATGDNMRTYYDVKGEGCYIKIGPVY